MGRAVTVMAVVAMFPSVAFPCSGATCEMSTTPVPANGATIPANAPVVGTQVALFSEFNWDGGIEYPSQTSVQVTLSDGSGPVPVTAAAANDGVFVAPTGGLVEGRAYGLTSSGFCAADAGFIVGPAAAMPTTAASLSVAALHIESSFDAICGGPSGVVQTALLRIEPSSEMVPWLPLARWELEVDGQNWSTAGYGRIGALPSEGAPGPFFQVNRFHVQCGPTDGGVRLGPGPHSARLLARIAGTTGAIASNTVSVTFDCMTSDFDAGLSWPAPDGGPCVEDLDAGRFCASDAGLIFVDGGTGGGLDGGTANPPPNPDLPAAPQGCTQAPGFSFGAALGLVWWWRRRARARVS